MRLAHLHLIECWTAALFRSWFHRFIGAEGLVELGAPLLLNARDARATSSCLYDPHSHEDRRDAHPARPLHSGAHKDHQSERRYEPSLSCAPRGKQRDGAVTLRKMACS